MKTYLDDSKESKYVIEYGRDIAAHAPRTLLGKALDWAIEHDLPAELADAYLEDCDENGIDPRMDQHKIEFGLYHLHISSSSGLVFAVVRYMHDEGLDPFVFDDEDAFHYLLGMISISCARNAAQSLAAEGRIGAAIALLVSTINPEDLE